METSLLLSLELTPTAMVGLGKHGIKIVDDFFDLLPLSLKDVGIIQQVTPTALDPIPEEHRPRGAEATLRFLISRAARASRSIEEADLDDAGRGRHRTRMDKTTLHTIFVASPFDDLSSGIAATASILMDVAAVEGIKALKVDVILLAEFQPGPAARRRAEYQLEELNQMIRSPIESDIEISFNLIWLDHTNESGTTLKKDLDTYSSLTIKILQLLLSRGRSSLLAKAESAVTEGEWVSAISIGYSGVEVPVNTLTRIGILRNLAQCLAEIGEGAAESAPDELIESIEQALEVDESTLTGHILENEAARSAERLAARLQNLPTSHFLLGGEPDPELTTVQAGIESLLAQASSQIGSGTTATQLARRQANQIVKLLEQHIDSSPTGLAEAELLLGQLLSGWRERERAAKAEVQAASHMIEQHSRKIAWLSDQNEKKSQQMTWQRPMLSMMIKALGLALPLGAVSAAAVFFLPGMRDVGPELIGASVGGSFITGFLVFLVRYLQDRTVIPELLHELGRTAERRLHLIAEEENLRFLQKMEGELSEANKRFAHYRDVLDKNSVALRLEANKTVDALREMNTQYHRILPVAEDEVSSAIERHMSGEDFLARLRLCMAIVPRTRSDVTEMKERVVAWGISELTPQLRGDIQLHPATLMQRFNPSAIGWDDLISYQETAAAPWFRPDKTNTSLAMTASGDHAADGGLATLASRTLVAVTDSIPPDLRRPMSASKNEVFQGAAAHAIGVFRITSGIPLNLLIASKKHDD